MWESISKEIQAKTGRNFELQKSPRSISGGCINQGYCLSGQDDTYFVKLNQANLLEMFEAELEGLQEIQATGTIKVPTPLGCGISDTYSYLILEWLDFHAVNNWQEMGRNLAQLHLVKASDSFGWQRNNTIGSTPQTNSFTASWADFFAIHRIGYQLKLAKRQGGVFGDIEKIILKVQTILSDRQPSPSLVHGDLWSGNVAMTTAGEPVILDPATYYGDREVDIAMTELFGGFPAAFYRGYNEVYPLDAQYPKRKSLYNLYHVLNHFNLFGGGYQGQAQQMIQQLFLEG